MPLQVTRVTTDEERRSAYAIRSAVFVNEQGLPGDRQFDEYDMLPDTFHFIGTDTDTGKVVATTRTMVVADERKGKVGRVAVLSECRGKNYGVAMMAAAEAAIQDQCDFFVLSAQCDKRGFYEKCGYRPMNDETYDEMGIEHLMMIKHVQRA